MISKFEDLRETVYNYIWNQLHVNTKPDQIVRDIAERFPTFIIFPDCDPTMQEEFILALVHQQMYLNQYKLTKLSKGE